MDRRAPVEYRLDLAWRIFTDTEIDKSRDPRQAFGILGSLRNDLVHKKSERTEISLHAEPEEVERLEKLGMIWLGAVREEYESPTYLDSIRSKLVPNSANERWLHRICSRAVAEWACDTIEQMAHELVARAPSTLGFRERLLEMSLGCNLTRRG